MATFKGVLKKISGGIKKATMVLPIVIGGLSILGLVGDGIAASVVKDKAEEGFMQTETYQTTVLEETKELTEQYENGTISLNEYVEGVNRFGTSNYIYEVINRDIEGNEKWQGMLKTTDALVISALSCIGGLVLAGVGCGLWYAGPTIADKLDYSADRDFQWEPPKKEKKPEPVVEVEEKKLDDISSDEQELGSLDDYLDSFSERT